MPKIERTARQSKPAAIMQASNLNAKIVSMKRVAVHNPPAKDAKLKSPKGYEVWEVEGEGTGNIEVRVEIPAKTHNIKDTAKRDEAVRALVADTAKPAITQALADHAG